MVCDGRRMGVVMVGCDGGGDVDGDCRWRFVVMRVVIVGGGL